MASCYEQLQISRVCHTPLADEIRESAIKASGQLAVLHAGRGHETGKCVEVSSSERMHGALTGY